MLFTNTNNMKKLLLYFLLFFTVSKNVFSAKEPAYVLIFKSLQVCNTVISKEFVCYDHLTVFPNHTASGYIEFVEDIPSIATINFKAYNENNDGSWSTSPLSIDRLTLCHFIERDVWFVPVGRLILNVPERCPIRNVLKVLHKRTKGIMPIGCLKARRMLMDNEKPLCCLDAVTKITEYWNRNENSCPPP